MDNKNQSCGYSIWLIPDSKSLKSLGRIIEDISFTTQTPKFEPHITLLGGFEGEEAELKEKFIKIYKNTNSFKVELVRTGYEDFYFRSFYMLASLNKKLLSLNEAIQRRFNRKEQYMPHLSLLYSNLKEEEKRKIISRLNLQLPVKIKITKIQLLKTEGEVEKWRKVVEVSLTTI